jgi:hypothetical protein
MASFPNTKLIPLTQGKHAIVDAGDYDKLIKLKWYYNKTGYAINLKYIRGSGRKNQKQTCLYMHRLIVNPPDEMYTDHINGDKLDNRRCNLRICTNKENTRNKKKTCGTSKYKGVSWDIKSSKWRASIAPNKICLYLGVFNTQEEAALAYNEAAIKYFGEFAKLNIIE